MGNKEPKHLKVFRIIGYSILSLGIILIFLGVFVIKMDFGFEGDKISNPTLYVPGVFLCFFSIPCLFIGFSAKIQKAQIATQKYIQEENKQELTDIVDSGADILSPAVTKITKAVKDVDNKALVFCKYCGTEIDADSKFCKSCGKEQ